MSTSLIRFEIQLPQFQSGSSQDLAVQQFLGNIQTLCPYLIYPCTLVDQVGNDTSSSLLYGMITTAQAPTALGFLNTLNAALGFQVVCITWNVNTQP